MWDKNEKSKWSIENRGWERGKNLEWSLGIWCGQPNKEGNSGEKSKFGTKILSLGLVMLHYMYLWGIQIKTISDGWNCEYGRLVQTTEDVDRWVYSIQVQEHMSQVKGFRGNEVNNEKTRRLVIKCWTTSWVKK